MAGSRKRRHHIPPSQNHHPPNTRATHDGCFSTSGSGDDPLLGTWTVHVVWLLLTAWRVMYVTDPNNWWTLHPDENFQSLEVAHTEVYGYGFRPYEFSSLSESRAEGAAGKMSLYRQREVELGMHGMRSALYPRFYVLVSWLAAFLGLDVRPYVLWKVAHAVVSSLLPLSVYRFTRVYFRSHDAGCVAAILVALSRQLNVLGTHPLLNSFLSPAVFWALSCLLPLIRGSSSSSSSVRNGVRFRKTDVRNGYVADVKKAHGSQNGHGGHVRKGRVSDVSKTHSSNNGQGCDVRKKHINGVSKAHSGMNGIGADVSKAHRGNNGIGVDVSKAHSGVNGIGTDVNRGNNGISTGVTKAYRSSNSITADVSKAHSTKNELGADVTKQNSSDLNGNPVLAPSTVLGMNGSHSAGCASPLLGGRVAEKETTGSSPSKNGGAGQPHSQPHRQPNNHSSTTVKNSLACDHGADDSSTKKSNTNTLTVTKVLGSISSKRESFIQFCSAFVLSLCVYMRIDVALLMTFTLLPVYHPRLAKYGSLLVCVLGGFAGLGLAVLEDFLFYEEVVLSPSNWAKFNIFQNLAGVLFGKSSFAKYFVVLFENGFALSCLVVVHMFVVVYVATKKTQMCFSNSWRQRNNTETSSDDSSLAEGRSLYNDGNDDKINESIQAEDDRYTDRPFNYAVPGKSSDDDVHRESHGLAMTLMPGAMLTISWVALLLFYSTREHKELRFIHNVLVLMLVTFAFILSTLLKSLIRPKVQQRHAQIIAVTVLCLFAADQWNHFPSSRDKSNQSWAYQRLWDSHDVNACLGYVSSQKDVTGVFVDSNFHITGGYALLHHDVPLFTLLVYEFVEFDLSVKTTLNKSTVLNPARNISYFTMDKMANFVTVQNAAYLVKLLIENKHYNYLVIAKDRKFLATGFKDVSAHGTMRVMKRTFQPEEERQLGIMASRVSTGVNATVLKYEGDVLFRFHRFHLALQRYQAAFQLNSSLAQIYQSIAACKQKLGDHVEARRWINACAEKFGVNECNKPLGLININPDRPLF